MIDYMSIEQKHKLKTYSSLSTLPCLSLNYTYDSQKVKKKYIKTNYTSTDKGNQTKPLELEYSCMLYKRRTKRAKREQATCIKRKYLPYIHA